MEAWRESKINFKPSYVDDAKFIREITKRLSNKEVVFLNWLNDQSVHAKEVFRQTLALREQESRLFSANLLCKAPATLLDLE
ncbi:MAG: hypothetical protein J7K36_02185 [Archaeoglobaceae archaeon]|nr:hypothetical protein [Archaeoglobaceae archaeon]